METILSLTIIVEGELVKIIYKSESAYTRRQRLIDTLHFGKCNR